MNGCPYSGWTGSASPSRGRRSSITSRSRSVQGEFTGLIGSNGVGKTTLLRVILGSQRADTGRSGSVARAHGQRGRSLGYVPQKVVLDPDMPMRARDLVALGLDAQKFGIRPPHEGTAQGRRTGTARCGCRGVRRRRVGRLSGGEQQRVLIAHALISRPKLLLLDEPLANLDPKSAQEIVALSPRVGGAQDRRPAVRPRDECAVAGNGPDRLLDRWAGGERHDRRGGALRCIEPAVRAPRGRPPAPRSVLVVAEPGQDDRDIPDHPTLNVS